MNDSFDRILAISLSHYYEDEKVSLGLVTGSMFFLCVNPVLRLDI